MSSNVSNVSLCLVQVVYEYIFAEVDKQKEAEHGQEFTEQMTGGQLERLPGEQFTSLPVHKDWPKLEKLLTDVDTAHLEMRDYDGGGLYGFCVPCAKWLDDKCNA